MADATKATNNLGWKPKINLTDLAKIMLDADMRQAGIKAIGKGDKILTEKFPNRWWKKD